MLSYKIELSFRLSRFCRSSNLKINLGLIYFLTLIDSIQDFHQLNLKIFALCNLNNFLKCLKEHKELEFIFLTFFSNPLKPSKDDFLSIISHYNLICYLGFFAKAILFIYYTLFMKSAAYGLHFGGNY